MANQRISALPRKAVPAANDIIPIVDLQFGSASSVNKKTTVGDLLTLANNYIDDKIAALPFVTSVSGRGGNVVLNLADIGGFAVTAAADKDFLVYDTAANNWTNKAFSNVDLILDCGEF
jgi:hypothetical protein